ncbi:HD-GYP domain-containing protein [Dyella psychrodurans]|uniref:HD domain-containing protein n=1 Tax=Dyella psychrodurans TaxID=1927960 RepID=A0A370XDR9_9GAMM|nr:HD domain-containing phosphohydrolase [Dyella psychrodurans]RDS86410.1 HD domain-containing protein [Dyella psychrodurans]
MSLSPQLRTAGIYIVVSAAWIWFSGHLLGNLVHDPHRIIQYQIFKGWFFVLGTGLLLYWLIGRTVRHLEDASQRLLDGHEQALHVLVEAMDARHKETSDHSERVVRMALGLARLAGLEGDALRDIKFGALLHDIGKLALPDAILIKPGKLDEDETRLMRTHPHIGYDMLQRIDFLRGASAIPYSHHERWDGTGYPQGLEGEDIPLAARIFSVVDVWDALSFPRVYKPAWPEPDVLSYLKGAAGSQLDPRLVQLFLDNYALLKTLALNPTT